MANSHDCSGAFHKHEQKINKKGKSNVFSITAKIQVNRALLSQHMKEWGGGVGGTGVLKQISFHGFQNMSFASTEEPFLFIKSIGQF